jgi:hypothetical protein
MPAACVELARIAKEDVCLTGQRRSVRQCHRSAFLLYELSVSFCRFVSTVCLHTLRTDTKMINEFIIIIIIIIIIF